jgi:hypothetical protein
MVDFRGPKRGVFVPRVLTVGPTSGFNTVLTVKLRDGRIISVPKIRFKNGRASFDSLPERV